MIASLLIMPLLIFANKLQRGLKALDKNDFEKAEQLILKSLEEEKELSPAANFAMAKMYFNKKFKGYNLHKAYDYLDIAAEDYDNSNKAENSKYGLTSTNLNLLKIKIETEALRKLSASEKAYVDYIDRFKDAHNLHHAIFHRNKHAFSSAQEENTVDAYEEFIKKYPNATQVEKAVQIRNKVAFDGAVELNTFQALDDFMLNYPDALQVPKARELRDNLARIELLEQEKEIKQLALEKQESELKSKSLEVKQHETFNQLLLTLLCSVLLILVVVAIMVFQVKKSNKKILKQNDTIQTQNTKILDSIKYAKMIQQAILPSNDKIKEAFPNSFVFFKPKDIVSGDFYWFQQVGDKAVIAALDCTGHGVPGAFMSMIGNTLLNQIVLREGVLEPAIILDRLREEVIKAMMQRDGDSAKNDGMDVALCVVDVKNKQVTYAGAFNPLYILRGDEVIQFKADRQPVGNLEMKNNNPFKQHVFDLKAEDRMYIFSDGFTDQFGGEKNKKFGSKKFRELIVDTKETDILLMEKELDTQFSKWKNTNEQDDDVLVIGVQV